MAGGTMRRLNWWFLTLAVVNIVDGERVQEHGLRSELCTTDINPLKNVCYVYEHTTMEQPMALAACEAKGGTLAALDTAETNNFVRNTIISKSVTSHFWIGYYEDNDKWYDGSPFVWSNYYKNEPNSAAEKCVIVLRDQDYTFGDNMCTNKHASLCQIPGTATQAHASIEEKMIGPLSLPRSELRAESKFRCAQYCLQDQLCGKFNFHPTTLKCTLYDVGAVVDDADGSQTFTF